MRQQTGLLLGNLIEFSEIWICLDYGSFFQLLSSSPAKEPKALFLALLAAPDTC